MTVARPTSAAGRPVVMGIVNVTPDSFSDGGRWFDEDAAVAHGLDLVAQGAGIVDVGGESTRPGAERPQPPQTPPAPAHIEQPLRRRWGWRGPVAA